MMNSLQFSAINYLNQKLWSGKNFSHFFLLSCLVIFKATVFIALIRRIFCTAFQDREASRRIRVTISSRYWQRKYGWKGFTFWTRRCNYILTMVLLILTESLLSILWIELLLFLSYHRLGDLWMNLDGSISPICLNILALASSSSELVLWDVLCF